MGNSAAAAAGTTPDEMVLQSFLEALSPNANGVYAAGGPTLFMKMGMPQKNRLLFGCFVPELCWWTDR